MLARGVTQNAYKETSLRSLSLNGCMLTDTFEVFASGVKQSKLDSLSLKNSGLKEKSVEWVTYLISIRAQNGKPMTRFSLDLTGNEIKSSALVVLSETLLEFPFLGELSLRNTGIQAKEFAILCKALVFISIYLWLIIVHSKRTDS
jgi:hypothetical protein